MADLIVWPGWLGGLGIGLYLLAQHWASNRPLGCSLSYGSLCALGSRMPYFTSGEFERRNHWRLWFILGIPFGGFIALVTSGVSWTPTLSMGALYDTVLPQALWAKALVLVGGGALMGYGARLAGGCASGPAVAGWALHIPPRLLAASRFFASG
jgi:uncharacterized membrane protein YedE/YeeE